MAKPTKQPQILRKRRRYADAFKMAIVQDYESGRFSVQQLCQIHGIASQTVYNWIHKLSHHNQKGTRIVEYADSSQEKLRQLQRKVAHLERALGQKQIELDLSAKIIEIASQELGMDLKKTFSTPPSAGSALTPTPPAS